MDPITSAWIFVIIGIFSALISSVVKKSVFASMAVILLNGISTAQLAYFTGLWPIYILTGLSFGTLLVLILVAAFLAIKDVTRA